MNISTNITHNTKIKKCPTSRFKSLPSVRSHNNPELINKMAPVVCIMKSRLHISQPYRKSIRIGFPNSFTGSQLTVRQQTLIQFLTRLINVNILANKNQLLPTITKRYLPVGLNISDHLFRPFYFWHRYPPTTRTAMLHGATRL